MNNLINFQQTNAEYSILPVNDPAFLQYGIIYKQYDLAEVNTVMKTQTVPKLGATYLESIAELEETKAIKAIGRDIYANMPIVAGATLGHSTTFTAFEYHQCSEVNIMIDDVIMVLAKRQTLEHQGYIDPNKDAAMFYVPAGTVIELYNDTLHYTPLEVWSKGYKVVVIVTKGTNKPLPKDFHSNNLRVVKQGKFQIVHASRKDKVALGYDVALSGELISVKPIN